MSEFKKGNGNYTGIVFENTFIEQDVEVDKQISFINCIFNGNVYLKEVKSKSKIIFKDCTFESLFVESCKFDTFILEDCKISRGEVILEKNIFTDLVFDNTIASDIYLNGIYEEITIMNCSISELKIKDVNTDYTVKDSLILLQRNKIESCKIESYKLYSKLNLASGNFDYLFFEGEFYKPLTFRGDLDIKLIVFESSNFTERVDVQGGYYESFYLFRCSFQKIFNIQTYEVSKNDSELLDIRFKTMRIHSCIFEYDVYLKMHEIKSLDFSNNDFKQTCNFSSYSEVVVNNDDFLVDISLDGTNQGNMIVNDTIGSISMSGINYGNILLKKSKFNFVTIDDFQNFGRVIFTNIDGGHFFGVNDSSLGSFQLNNFNINSYKEVVFSNSDITKIKVPYYIKNIKSFSSNPKIGFGLEDKKNNFKNLNLVYNQLKQSSKKNGETDLYHKYKSKELKFLLLDKKFSYDTFLLLINFLSNDNGKSWLRGVLFTIAISYLFYRLYLLNFNIDSSTEHWKDFITYFSTFPKLELEKYSNLGEKHKVSFTIWMSRIFVGYGIYQTISAFRKYGK